MKNFYSLFKVEGAIIISFLLLCYAAQADTYTSVKDGHWGVDDTWGNNQGNVPGAGDDVIINHNVAITFYWAPPGRQCNNITINGSLTGVASAGGSASITAFGNFVNNGTVDNTSAFYVYVHGNISNYGAMTNYYIGFSSTTQDQYLTVSPGYVFNCYELEAVSSSYSLITSNNLIFDNVNVDINRELIMNDGAVFTIQNDSYIWNLTLTTASMVSIDIYSSGNSKMHNTTINVSTVNLSGDIYLDGNTIFNGDVFVNNYFQCNGNRLPEIHGNLTIENGATVRNDPDGVGNMTLILNGDLTNNGTIDIYKIIFSGDQAQNITMGTGSTYAFEYFLADNSSYHVILQSDLTLTNPVINFDYRTLELAGTYTLDINGIGYNNQSTYEITFQGNTGNTITFQWDAFIVSTTFNDITVDGNLQVYSNCFFNDVTITTGASLQARESYDRTVVVTGDFINNGSITQNASGGDVILEIYNHLENNGTWEALYTYLLGTGDQYIIATEPFTGLNFISDKASGIVIANSDVMFYGVKTDFNANTFDLSGNTLYIDDWYFRDATLLSSAKGTVIINGTEDCYLEYVNVDDIQIQGTVAVGSYCNFGSVDVQGTMQSRLTTYAVSLPISGDIMNYGSVIDGPLGNFYVEIGGDIINDGIWNIYHTDLTGATDQEISCLNSSYFAGHDFRGLKSGGDTYALTDITFSDILVDFNYSKLYCATDIDIVLDGNYTAEVKFEGIGTPLPRLNCTNSNYIYYTDVNNFALYGKIQTYGTCVLENITVEDTLQNRNTSSVTTSVNGTLTNNGIVQNATSGNFTLNVNGDIINNGMFSNYTINLVHATNDQFITCGPSGIFASTNFHTNKTAGDIIALSDIRFENTLIDGYTKTFDFTGGFDLSIDGGRLYRTDLIGTAAADDYSVLFMDNDAYFYNSFGQNLELQGVVMTYGSSSFENILVSGTLQNRDAGSVTTPVYGQLENQGTIKNSDVSGNLTLDLYGDVINNGIWSHYYIYLKGDTPQHISCLNGSIFDLTYFACQNTADLIIADNDLNFSGTQIDFSNDDLDLTGGNNMSMDGGRLYRCNVMATQSSVFDFSNGAYFYNSSLDVGTLNGNFQTYGTCTLGTIIINGALENLAGSSVTTTITGDVINNGEVRNNTVSANLILLVEGSVTNKGPWTNYRTDFTGTIDQEINIPDNNNITGDVRFLSGLTGSPYQWYYEGAILNNADFTGETTSTLTWLLPVSDAYFGTFFCQTTNGPSRNIIVSPGGLRLDITIFIEGPYNGSTLNTDLNTMGLIPLSQPYGGAPWLYSGTESVGTIPNADIVDWILVELRDAVSAASADTGTVVGVQAGFLLNNGKIVGLDGISNLSFDVTISNNLYIVVWQRNHIGVMSNNAVIPSGGIYTYDFTIGPGQAYNYGQKDIGGVYGMYAGDGDANGIIDTNDKSNVWAPQVGIKGYLPGDFDMNSQVMNQDKNDVWVDNIGAGCQVPE